MKLWKIISSLLTAFCILFTVFYGGNKISEQTIVAKAQYKGIITLWQIDCFEGGMGSRKQFLLSSARSYEKENQGVLVMVISHTPQTAVQAVNEGQMPDLISYGVGVQSFGAKEIDVDKVFIGGKVGDIVFATPWCMGGYFLITNPSITQDLQQKNIENLVVSQGEFTQPLTAFVTSGYIAKNIEILPPMDAYVKFTAGKTSHFLGTQRDIVRLNNRGMPYCAVALCGFNDIYQYISLTSSDNIKAEYSLKFIQHLLGEGVQQKLNQIGMNSLFYNVTQSYEELNDLQNVKFGSTISAFTAKEQINQMQELSLRASKGEQKAILKLKNMLLLP